MKNTSKIVALLLTIAVCIGCSENPTSTPVQKIGKLTDYKMPNYENIFDEYKYADLTGIIHLKNENNDAFDIFYDNGVNDTVDSQFESKSMKALFYNDNYKAYDVDMFKLNSKEFTQVKMGYFEGKNEELDFNNGKDNKLTVQSENNFSISDLSVILSDEANIINLKRNDAISKKEKFLLAWTGGTADSKIEIEILYSNLSDPVVVANETLGVGVSWELDNSGSVDLNPFLKQLDYLGTYDIKLTIFEPHIIEIDNGDEVLLVDESSHKISFVLTN
jgi:hypothetical protein